MEAEHPSLELGNLFFLHAFRAGPFLATPDSNTILCSKENYAPWSQISPLGVQQNRIPLSSFYRILHTCRASLSTMASTVTVELLCTSSFVEYYIPMCAKNLFYCVLHISNYTHFMCVHKEITCLKGQTSSRS